MDRARSGDRFVGDLVRETRDLGLLVRDAKEGESAGREELNEAQAEEGHDEAARGGGEHARERR